MGLRSFGPLGFTIQFLGVYVKSQLETVGAGPPAYHPQPVLDLHGSRGPSDYYAVPARTVKDLLWTLTRRSIPHIR